ncbi:ATP-binding protein [Natranaerofaba carboxydovora]|uniref:ATP-binding protein n=1 Tax=Natranaerofaba carboxydovora TaxID=2742683 RepID=UPI001F12F9FF|nr:ATP-binding protein [Natranaerofaba carboxydovora]UMZ74360.1 hypothetical protein ACONDI_01948 [Natranaerofaba carboxydovora]
MSKIDLLNPSRFMRENYINQIRETIEAYSDSMIVLGEALQNAVDAVCDNPNIKKGKVDILLDFDDNLVKVRDNGLGFPNELSLLFLGGTDKTTKNRKGKIGVGIKVTLFSSEFFCIRSNLGDDNWKIEINNANNFEDMSELNIPEELPKDLEPLEEKGTELAYKLEKKTFDNFINELYTSCLEDSKFDKAVSEYNTSYPSIFAALLAAYLQRFTYIGDVLNTLNMQDNYPEEGIDINLTISCRDSKNRLPARLSEWFGDKEEQTFKIEPKYFTVEDSLNWVPKGKKAPSIFDDKLGRGGKGVQRTDGFNHLKLDKIEDYRELLRNSRGKLPEQLKEYEEKLFPSINGIMITIGRIPEFEIYLPGSSRRVISCNGVVTNHDLDITSGSNQHYVRCLDLVIDVKANLNYGKTQLTNMHLVKLIRDYINDAYTRVLQKAAGIWVGKFPAMIDDEDDEVTYVGRKNLEDIVGDLSIDLISQKEPHDENDVIGLFFELAGKCLFPGYKIFGLSQIDTFDGRAAIIREADEDNEEKYFNPTDDAKLRKIEFKKEATEVIRDFDREQKDAKELDLLIAWEEGNYSGSENYSIYDIDQSNAYRVSPKKVFPNVTKFIYDAREGSEVQVVLLKDLLNVYTVE